MTSDWYSRMSLYGQEFKYNISFGITAIRYPNDGAVTLHNYEFGIYVTPDNVSGPEQYKVTPSMVAAYIRNGTTIHNPEEHFRSCDHIDDVRKLRYDPYEEKNLLTNRMWYCCDGCYEHETRV